MFTAALAIADPGAGPGIVSQFALYGALHAAALALSLGNGAGQSPRRQLLFVGIAAVFALSTARLGLYGLHFANEHGGAAAAPAVLGACAGWGALAYGALIRILLTAPRGAGLRVGPRSLGAISLGCAAVTALCFAVCRGLHAAGVLWLVAPWWFAFSSGLCYAAAKESYKMAT